MLNNLINIVLNVSGTLIIILIILLSYLVIFKKDLDKHDYLLAKALVVSGVIYAITAVIGEHVDFKNRVAISQKLLASDKVLNILTYQNLKMNDFIVRNTACDTTSYIQTPICQAITNRIISQHYNNVLPVDLSYAFVNSAQGKLIMIENVQQQRTNIDRLAESLTLDAIKQTESK